MTIPGEKLTRKFARLDLANQLLPLEMTDEARTSIFNGFSLRFLRWHYPEQV